MRKSGLAFPKMSAIARPWRSLPVIGWLWVMIFCQFANLGCGLLICMSSGMTSGLRLLGLAVTLITTISGFCLFWSKQHALPALEIGPLKATAPALPQFGPAAAPAQAEIPAALGSAAAGTPRDMHTAMGLFGSAILDQVETSVSTIVKENQKMMREIANEMAAGAAQAQTQLKTAAARSSEAEGAFEQLNEVSGELAGAIGVIGAAARDSLATVTESIAQAAATRSCIQTMALLSEAVSQAIELIDQVARQTKMLSINALIEAARAGSAGKGFAVVAGEVRTLANQTAAATQTIGEKIAQLNGMVAKSVDALHALVGTIENVALSNQSIADAVVMQESMSSRLLVSSKSMHEAVYTLSKEIREAAQLASNGGMLSEVVMETAISVDDLMKTLKHNLEEIGVGMKPVVAFEKQRDIEFEAAVLA